MKINFFSLLSFTYFSFVWFFFEERKIHYEQICDSLFVCVCVYDIRRKHFSIHPFSLFDSGFFLLDQTWNQNWKKKNRNAFFNNNQHHHHHHFIHNIFWTRVCVCVCIILDFFFISFFSYFDFIFRFFFVLFWFHDHIMVVVFSISWKFSRKIWLLLNLFCFVFCIAFIFIKLNVFQSLIYNDDVENQKGSMKTNEKIYIFFSICFFFVVNYLSPWFLLFVKNLICKWFFSKYKLFSINNQAYFHHVDFYFLLSIFSNKYCLVG